MLDPRLVHMEQRCISVSALSSGSHVIHFADGSTYEADLVIGADGIKSVIRDFVTGRPTPLAYSNSVAYRSVVPSEAFKDLKTDMMRPLCWIGKNRVSIDVPLPWAKLVSQDELLHEFSQAGWGEDANLILKEMKNPSKWYLHFLHPPLSSYVRQRVVLLGDAAHAMLPYLGSGAGQGFEDVYALCSLLGDARARKCHIDDVLEVYDSIRVARANMVQKLSTLMGNIVEKRGPGGGTNAQIQEQLRDIYHPIWHHDLKEEVKRAVTSVYGL
ncbi:Salicylate hydroxylase [Termitomyces sp. J132]|nr:Salicylate hydroxylase [Termitomyces sp. J132]